MNLPPETVLDQIRAEYREQLELEERSTWRDTAALLWGERWADRAASILAFHEAETAIRIVEAA